MLESNSSSAIWSSAKRSANLGTGKHVGLLSVSPRALVKSELVIGCGETTFIAPLNFSFITNSTAREASSRLIQLKN